MALALCAMLVSAALAGGYVARCSGQSGGVTSIYSVSGAGTAIGTLVQTFHVGDPQDAVWFDQTKGDLYVVERLGSPWVIDRYLYAGNGVWSTTRDQNYTSVINASYGAFGLAIDSSGNQYSGADDGNQWVSKNSSAGGTWAQWVQIPGAGLDAPYSTGGLFWDMRINPAGTMLWAAKCSGSGNPTPYGIQGINLSTGALGMVAGSGIDYRGFDFAPSNVTFQGTNYGGYIYAASNYGTAGNGIDILSPTTGGLQAHFITNSPHLLTSAGTACTIMSLKFGPDYNNDGIEDIYVGCIDMSHPGLDVFSGATGTWLGHISDADRTFSVAAWPIPTNLQVNVTLAWLDPSADLTMIPAVVDVLDSASNIAQTQTILASQGHGWPVVVSPQFTMVPGSYTVKVSAPGYLVMKTPVTINSSGSVTVNSALMSGDINGDNFVEDQDYSILGVGWYQGGD
jgi:hypothetical protein